MFPPRSFRSYRACRCVRLASLVLAVPAGCAIPPPETDPAADIRDAVGLDAAVEFHVEAAPLDQPFAGAQLDEALAIRRAVETSAELQAALARVGVAAKAAELAGKLPNPVLTLVLRQPSDDLSTQVFAGISENLLEILQRPERAAAAGHRLMAEAAAALSTALDIVADVQVRYAECQVLEALVPALERRASLLDRLVDEAGKQRELGLASRHDLATVESQRIELSIELSRRRQELRLARLALARRIGEPSGAADWAIEPWSRPPTVVIDEASWVQAALSSRPELAALDWELRARTEDEALASGLPWDDATVGVEAEKQDWDAEEDGWAVGPSVETPLAIFDTPEDRREQARVHTAEARHLILATQRAVVEDVRGALTTLQTAQENLLRVESELIPLQERRQAEVEEDHRTGQIDLTAVLMSAEALGRAQEIRLELERELSAALFRLQRAVGGPMRFRTLPAIVLANPF